MFNTNDMIELRRMTSYLSESGLEALLLEDYKSLLFYKEIDRMKFSLCDQYSTIRVNIKVLTICMTQPCLYNKTNKKTCF